jgi:hypothetical protein
MFRDEAFQLIHEFGGGAHRKPGVDPRFEGKSADLLQSLGFDMQGTVAADVTERRPAPKRQRGGEALVGPLSATV